MRGLPLLGLVSNANFILCLGCLDKMEKPLHIFRRTESVHSTGFKGHGLFKN